MGKFWLLLEFGMQMVLLIVTGYTIALSPFIKNKINSLAILIKTPTQVYFTVTLFGLLVSLHFHLVLTQVCKSSPLVAWQLYH